MKIHRKRNNYIRIFGDFVVNVLLFIALSVIVFTVYKIIYYILQHIPNISTIYGNLISASVTIILAFISYIVKMKTYFPILLHKIKQRVYCLVSWKHNPFFAFIITDFNKNNLSGTDEQGKFINSAIHILKNNTQNTILVSGYSGRGKTTSIMLLLNAIAHDQELFWVFSELQNRIVYFDSINDKEELLKYLDCVTEQKCKLIIIDNIQKYTIPFINKVMGKIKNLSLYNQNVRKRALIVLLYQETDRNKSLFEYIKKSFFKENNNIFKLNQYVNIETSTCRKKDCSQEEELLKKYIDKIENSFFRQHIKNILYSRKDDSIIAFLNNLVFQQPIRLPANKEKPLFVLMAAIFIGFYNGYVTKKELHFLWRKNYSLFSLYQENTLIRYYVRNCVLTPFPFVRSAYIFNEELAREYRKRMMCNDYYLEKSCIMAENLFSHCEESLPQKWLFFLLCSSDYCKNFLQCKRMLYFENALSAYHLQYILDLVETEISILPDKKDVFRQELGIIYIYNGEWKKAKQILYPYMQSYNMNKDIWHIQLKIIEAEHGGSDEHYLEMLTCMESECTEPVILFQIRYWREHIRMEHGEFSLDIWERMVQEIASNYELQQLRKDEHFSIRIVSDYERTYFLKGNIEYPRYKRIISEYLRLSNKNDQNEEPIECVLSHAYYIQYDVLYQLGIWGYQKYGQIAPDIICGSEHIADDDVLNTLLNKALDKYDICIRKYQSEGKKKYRTLEVRRAELALCMGTEHYIETLNQYENFEHYVDQNNITVFKGYCYTQKGKAFALYADCMLRENDLGRFEEYLKNAEGYLLKAQKIYEGWGNAYGAFRAELLIILIHMLQDRDSKILIHINVDNYQNRYNNLLSNLAQKYNSEHKFAREHNIINYLQQNISRMDAPLRIFKFYPIILQ